MSIVLGISLLSLFLAAVGFYIGLTSPARKSRRTSVLRKGLIIQRLDGSRPLAADVLLAGNRYGGTDAENSDSIVELVWAGLIRQTLVGQTLVYSLPDAAVPVA